MNQSLIDTVLGDLKGEILHSAEADGTVAVVEQRGQTRWYHAQAFTDDGTEKGGYSTSDKHWYMGENFRHPVLWGEYYSEVFWVDGKSHETKSKTE